MFNPVFAGTFDLTALIFTVFVLFFIGLVIYLRREDRREGYPLEHDVSGVLEAPSGLFFTARPKTFILAHGQGVISKPNAVRETREIAAARTAMSPGSPLEPIGDPMLAGVGPGAFAQRARHPDVMLNGAAKIVPLRLDPAYSLGPAHADPRGMTVFGADRAPAGIVTDVWVDRAEFVVRYLEVELSGAPEPGLSVVGAAPAGRRVLVPMTMAVIRKDRKTVAVNAIRARQFTGVPALAHPDQVTFDEEERVCAYYGGGFLYATSARAEPLI